MCLTDLPDELIHEIFKYMTWRQISLISRVNKRIKKSLRQLDMFGKGRINRNIYDITFMYDAKIQSDWYDWPCLRKEGLQFKKLNSKLPHSILRHSRQLHDISIFYSPHEPFFIKNVLVTNIRILTLYSYLDPPIFFTTSQCTLSHYLCTLCKDGIRRFAFNCTLKVCAFCCTDVKCKRHRSYKQSHFCKSDHFAKRNDQLGEAEHIRTVTRDTMIMSAQR
jgi:hypothetical protein